MEQSRAWKSVTVIHHSFKAVQVCSDQVSIAYQCTQCQSSANGGNIVSVLLVAAMQFNDLAKECKEANIQAFPAWIIKGQTYSGAQSFDKLEKILDSQ